MFGGNVRTLRWLILVGIAAYFNTGLARNFQFQLYKGESSSENRSYFSHSTKRDVFKIIVGSAGTKDPDDEIEIRAATLLKEIKSKRCVINDVAIYRFRPARGRQIFYVAAGFANGSRDNLSWIGSDCSHGYIKGGVIIEIRQCGKVLKHWSSATGPISKTKLADSVKCAYINEKGWAQSGYSETFDNATQITADENNPEPEEKKEDEGGRQEEGEFALSDFSMGMFRADSNLKQMTRKGTLSFSDNYYGSFSEKRMTHWSVSITLECSDGCFTVYGYAPKSSTVGDRLKDLLKDGAVHRAVIRISRSKSNYDSARYVIVDDFREIKREMAAVDEDQKCNSDDLVASDYSFALFRADVGKSSITFPTKIQLSDRYFSIFASSQASHWSINILYSSGDCCWSSVTGYVEKESPIGKRLIELLKDGGQHSVLLKVARSQEGPMGTRVVIIKGFKNLEQKDLLKTKSMSNTCTEDNPAPIHRGISQSNDDSNQQVRKVSQEELIRIENAHEQEMIRRRQSGRSTGK